MKISTRLVACALPVALGLVACSADSSSASSGGLGCVEPGTFQETYTLRPGSNALCDPIQGKSAKESASNAVAQPECKSSCTCSGSLTGSTCGGTWKEVCPNDKGELVYSVDIQRASSTHFTGTVSVTSKGGPLDFTCSYDWTYDRVGP